MASHTFRVRRNTPDGLKVVGFFGTIGKANAFAGKRMRETGNLFRIERRIPLGTGWEIAIELMPDTKSPVEGAIARGRLPKVQDANGRKGQVLSYIRPSREVWVAWTDAGRPGKGDLVPVDQLTLR